MSDIINPSLKTAVKGTSLVFLGMVSSVLLWFLTKILIIRYTTKEEFGLYSLLVAIVGIFSVISTLGSSGRCRPVYCCLYRRRQKKRSKGDCNRRTFYQLVQVCVFFFSCFIPQESFPSTFFINLNWKSVEDNFFSYPFFSYGERYERHAERPQYIKSKVYADMGQPLFFLCSSAYSFCLSFPS